LSVDFSDEWLRRQVREFNKDIPRIRLPLTLLLEMDTPYVETIGGDRHYFDKKELRELAEVLPKELLDRLRLPLVFKRSLEVEESLYFLDGGEVEVEVLKRLVGLSYIPSRGRQYYTYKPIISKLISKFPSIVVIGVV
jgi:uncharacterized protein (UPF0216 family)